MSIKGYSFPVDKAYRYALDRVTRAAGQEQHPVKKRGGGRTAGAGRGAMTQATQYNLMVFTG